MSNAFFNIIITPIIQVLEFFFSFFLEITNNVCLSIFGLSLIVTLFTLPLYMTAEKWQEEERKIKEILKNGVSMIKKAFSGDEQYLMLSEYYRQNNYHPLMALRSSFSLLIQIPFFMAAYNFLSHLEVLKGVSFLFIKDFGNPDATFYIGSFSVNILPIAMTLINCVSGIIYSKGHGINEKIQIFGCAAVFLVLLYNSPSGLVVYWTMNNIFSLTKNVFYKLKNPKKAIYIIMCIVSVFCVISIFTFFKTSKKEIKLIILLFAIILPFVFYIAKKISNIFEESFAILDKNKNIRFLLFILSAILLAFLAGLHIPTTLMESEPEQYCYVENFTSPFVFVWDTLFKAIGLFILWPICFYGLFSVKIKKTISISFSALAFIALLNVFVFSEKYGPILAECLFMQPQMFMPSFASLVFNFLLIFAIIALTVILLKKKPTIVCYLSLISILAIFIGITSNIAKINSSYKKMVHPTVEKDIKPVFHLSKNGKNVIVLMQDRLILPFIEPCFEEKPEFRTIFDGFTFYKNTVSMGPLTMIGTPGIFGGYSFTPWEINKRSTETLQKKHNEALLTLPKVFHDVGFDITVSGLPYENYHEYPITDMYKGFDYVNRVELHGAYSDRWYMDHGIEKIQYLVKKIKRNSICFSIFKMVSPVFRRFVYHNEYWAPYDSYSDGFPCFVDNYSELEYLPKLIDTESKNDSLILLVNDTVHESILLDAPDFVPTGKKVTSFSNNKYAKDPHWTTMMAVFNLYEKFFQQLKDLGVYDNTRIIIVSDHGIGIDNVDFFSKDIGHLRKTDVLSSLLVKDFNATGEIKTDMTFMTNADTPYLATKDIIEDAKNPWTMTPFKIENKNKYIKIQVAPSESTRIRKNTQFTVQEDEWFTVHDNIYVDENWDRYVEKE